MLTRRLRIKVMCPLSSFRPFLASHYFNKSQLLQLSGRLASLMTLSHQFCLFQRCLFREPKGKKRHIIGLMCELD